MIQFTYELRNGYILSLTELRDLLAGINQGADSWSLESNPPVGDDDRTRVTILYSNPIYPGLPNTLAFQFPLMRLYSTTWDSPDSTYVCIHPEAADATQEGLYFSEDQLLNDCVYDMTIFWGKLSEALRTHVDVTIDRDLVREVFLPPPA
jgi:hypothetical protein